MPKCRDNWRSKRARAKRNAQRRDGLLSRESRRLMILSLRTAIVRLYTGLSNADSQIISDSPREMVFRSKKPVDETTAGGTRRFRLYRRIGVRASTNQ